MNGLYKEELDELYNDNLKKRFIKKYAISIQPTIYHMFQASKILEDEFNKDIFAFSAEELKILFGEFEARSLGSLEIKRSYLDSYVNFAREQGYVKTMLNNISLFNKDILKGFVDQRAIENKYITQEDLDDIVMGYGICENPQDAIPFIFAWLGIKGEKLCEQRNLKEKDIDFDNYKIKIIDDDDGNERTIDVDEDNRKYFSIIRDAIDQLDYLKYNDESGQLKSKSLELIDTDYVLKKAGKSRSGKIGYQTILGRFKKIKLLFGNKYLTLNSIYRSGMFHYARGLKNKNGELTGKDYELICKKYNFNNLHQAQQLIEKNI